MVSIVSILFRFIYFLDLANQEIVKCQISQLTILHYSDPYSDKMQMNRSFSVP